MPELTIHFDKKSDGVTVLTCFRPNGTSTWQRRDCHGVFFVLHDLMYFAVEQECRLDGGFYGLLSRGWDISDFGNPWPKGPIPAARKPDAEFAEHLAGVLGLEPSGNVLELKDVLSTLAESHTALTKAKEMLSESSLQRIRGKYAELARSWMTVDVGECLTLEFST